jgi:4-hydroxy-tetrahydrodipicolinate reductase|tara:strand:- start:2257 stop:2928 length:672 start_codon:yes stop_codon:yes gene_type:complete
MNIAIFGNGRMGKLISRLAIERGHSIVVISNSKQPATKCNLSNVDVAIDFSLPNVAFDNISYAIKNETAIISGTTNWLGRLEEVRNMCLEQKGAFLYASNFSLGMNIFFQLNKKLAKLIKGGGYIGSIEETHHLNKLDSPSGTAISLYNDLKDILMEEIPINSKRISDEIGTHKINYSSKIDDIEIIHRAKTRDGFALGAIIAAEWILDKKGVFSMQDLLKHN